MVFSPINHHNHYSHSVVGFLWGFYWVLCVVLCWRPSKLWRFDALWREVWFTAVWIVFYFNLQIGKFLSALLSVFTENRREKLPPSRGWWESDLLRVLTGPGPETVLINVLPCRLWLSPRLSPRHPQAPRAHQQPCSRLCHRS